MTDTGEDLWITVSAFRTDMSHILREVERGKTFTLVRRGRAVARILGCEPRSIGADLIRDGRVAATTRTAEPRIPLFKSGMPDLASSVDDYLEGFSGDR